MKSTSASIELTPEQTLIWLRSLLMLAWADGDFDAAEQDLIASITHQELTQNNQRPQPVALEELASFKQTPQLIENFLRTAVMVALADGLYTSTENEILEQFVQTLGSGAEILQTLRLTLCEVQPDQTTIAPHPDVHHDRLQPVRSWLDGLEIHDPKVAHFLCKLIPAQCPFERDIKLFDRKIVHIPPLCKLNPLYDQLVGLRFRALSYLADERGEDVTPYC